MVITTTGIAFSLSSIGLALCGFRFFEAFRKTGEQRASSRIGLLLFGHLIFAAFVLGLLGVGSLLFATDPAALYYILLASHLPLIVTSSLGIYLIYFIFFPRHSPWPSVIATVALGIFIILSTVAVHPLPFVDASGGVDWNMPGWLSIMLSLLVFLEICSTLYIFYRLYVRAPTREVKYLSLFLTIFSSLALINHLVRFTFFVIESPDSRTRVYDLILAFVGAAYVMVFLIFPFTHAWISKIRKDRRNALGVER